MRNITNKIKKVLYLLISIFFRTTTKIKKKRIVCWSYHFNKYSCNPRYIAEYLSIYHPDEYDIYWIQNKNSDISLIDNRIKMVHPYTLRYFYIINSAHILIYNTRTYLFNDFWIKKKGQIYIMTWHATMGIKKIEKDAEKSLGEYYVKYAKRDSKMCDLILSGCRYYTNRFKESFWYNGEILEKGNPRNDILFKDASKIREKVYSLYNIPKNSKILLYAPTFRNDYSLDCYKFNWQDIIDILNKRYQCNYYVLLKLHPNFLSQNYSSEKIKGNSYTINATEYPDMQELLCIADILVTDYSSSMFDFGIINKPCFLYATDIQKYDRGFEFDLNKLPFPVATNDFELQNIIKNYNENNYQSKLENFNTNFLGVVENGHASEAFYEWIKEKTK